MVRALKLASERFLSGPGPQRGAWRNVAGFYIGFCFRYMRHCINWPRARITQFGIYDVFFPFSMLCFGLLLVYSCSSVIIYDTPRFENP